LLLEITPKYQKPGIEKSIWQNAMVSRIHKGNKSDIIVVHFNNLSKGCKSINDTQSDNFVEPFTKIEPSISNVGRTNIPVGSTNRTSKAP